MKENLDYTRLPIGHCLSDGRKIEKCPKCGRNGARSDLGEIDWFEHFGLERFTTAAGEVHGKSIRKHSTCRVNKNR